MSSGDYLCRDDNMLNRIKAMLDVAIPADCSKVKIINYIEEIRQENEQLKEMLRKCMIISNNVLYFDDNSDYSTALWQILNVTQGRKETYDCYDIKLEYRDD